MNNKETFETIYIGTGKAVEQFPSMVEVSICMDDCEQDIFEYKGKLYLKFTVSPLRKTSEYGKTHAVYLRRKVAVENENTLADRDELKEAGKDAQAELEAVAEAPQRKPRRKAAKKPTA